MPNIVNGLGQVKVGVRIASGGGGGIDTDAQAFITAANITDTTQQSAINTLVTQLKTYGIWTKMKALYPFVGGTASSHKWNLKDPRDLDAAYRLVFNGGWVHSSTGAKPNGTNGYYSTALNPSSALQTNNVSLTVYLRTDYNDPNGVVVDFGTPYYGGNVGVHIYSRSTNLMYVRANSYPMAYTNNDSLGLHGVTRVDGTNLSFIRHSTLSTTGAQSFSNSNNIIYGAYGGSGYYSPREQAFASIGDGLTSTEVANFYTAIQTFQTTLGRQVGVPIVADSDAQAFLNAAVITNTTQANAINTLVTSLKSANIWTKMKAIYPFVGGTATTHKFNLKDPRDLDAAYRLVFNGGWTHSTTGALPNGTTAYADTKLIPSSAISNQSSAHLSFYSNTNSFPTVNGTIKANGGYTFPPLKGLQIGYWKRGSGQNTYYFQIGGGTEILVDTATPTSQGFLLGSRTSSTAAKLYQNNTTLGSSSTLTTDGLSSAVTYLGARNGNSVIEQYHNLNHQFTSIGDGLTDAEATALYNAVQAYQTTLGRQI